MKVAFLIVIAGAACLAAPTAQAAAPPKAAGKYAVIGHSLCSAKATTTQAIFRLSTGGTSTGVKTFNTQENGILSALTGYLTLTPASAGASNGTGTLSFTQIRGPTSSVNAPSSGWSQNTSNFSGNYSFTATTMKFGADTFQMTYGNVVSGVARTINLIRRETGANPDCVDAMTATKQ